MADGDNVGRVLIGFDDSPLEPTPTWTRLDDTNNLVVTIELTAGRQEENEETETNHATIRLNDRTGIFDPNNVSSPYFGKLHSKPILIQVYNPVTATWHERFWGTIKKWEHDLYEGTRDGVSILSNITLEAVGLFDYLARTELIAGVHGDTPPAGEEDTVFYEDGEVDARIIQLFTDAGVDSTRYVTFSGNVMVGETSYDSGDSLLTAIRDAADAEAQTLGNVYEDRHGRGVFHGRQSKLDPATVAAGAGPTAWDYQTFKIGDGAAISGDSDYAQIRPPFGFISDVDDIINTALIIPRSADRTTIASLVESDATSIGDHGPRPFTYQDSINDGHKTNGDTAAEDCQKTAQYLVGNYKDPLVRAETATVKSLRPTDARAAATWAVLAKADIADSVHLKVGYPDGQGIDSDFFIEGWTQTITPLDGDYDLVELVLNLSPQPTFNPYDD